MIGEWLDIGWLHEIPVRGSRTVPVDGGEEIAVFRTGDNQVFALVNRCPHKGGPLSQGIVHGHSVACPLHNWNIALRTGEAQGNDKGCTPVIPVKVNAGRVLICRAGALKAAA
jgi:nitrite reductase (NADH) small subunit